MTSEISEEQIAQKWRDLAHMADVLNRRSDTEGEFATVPGSPIAGDDACLGGYPLTSAFRFCLAAAIDHLHAVTTLIVDHKTLHVAAPASLARGILENAATAFWLIHPKSRDERITRTLRWWAKNAKDQEDAVGGRDLGGSTKADVRSRLQGLADDRGVDAGAATKPYFSTEVVKYADKHTASLDGVNLGVLLPWQLCSGYAHGRPWAYMGGSEAALPENGLPKRGVGEVRLTSSLGRALYPTLAGFDLLEATLRLHRVRTTPHTEALTPD